MLSFVLQKIVARLFFPLPIVFWLAGAAFLAARHRRRRTARALGAAALAWLFLISWNPVGDLLLGTLENRYAPLGEVPRGVTHIVVLGGGAHADRNRPPSVRLSRSSQGRVLEGVRIWHAAAGADAGAGSAAAPEPPKLIFTGGSLDGRQSMASLAAETAQHLGVPEAHIKAFGDPLNTEAEARTIADYLEHSAAAGSRGGGGATLVLVTSASHMPRSVALFRRQGLDPIPAPAQFLTDPGGRTSWALFPDAAALTKTERFFYEVLGLAWMLVRG